MTTLQIIITGTFGIFTGALGSLIAPWAKWGMEKRKLQYDNRKKLIRSVKNYFTSEKFDRTQFVDTSYYISIKEHLSDDSIKYLETPLNEINLTCLGHNPIDKYKNNLLKDLSEIEKKWKMI